MDNNYRPNPKRNRWCHSDRHWGASSEIPVDQSGTQIESPCSYNALESAQRILSNFILDLNRALDFKMPINFDQKFKLILSKFIAWLECKPTEDKIKKIRDKIIEIIDKYLNKKNIGKKDKDILNFYRQQFLS